MRCWKMTMQMVFLIQMGGDQHLIFLAPQLPGQLYADAGAAHAGLRQR